jgi:cephalosporin hydroxylase
MKKHLLSAFRSPLSLFARNRTTLGAHLPVFMEPALSEEEDQCVQSFSRLYYEQLDKGRGLHTVVLSWMGHELFKCPMDLWIYQELIFMHKFDLVVEIGTYKGGSTLYIANMLDLVNNGSVISVDVDDSHRDVRPRHPRIEYLLGSSTDQKIFGRIKQAAQGKTNPLVILDGDHRCDNVLRELKFYQQLIQPGGYLIVEDTNVNGHPAFENHGPGPWEAVDAFLQENTEFVPDRTCERFLLTMNPRGYLRRRSQLSLGT